MIKYRLDFAKKYLDDAAELFTNKGSTALHQGLIMHHIKPCGLLWANPGMEKSGDISQ